MTHVNSLLILHLLLCAFASAILLPHPQSIVQNSPPLATELARFNLTLPDSGNANNTILTAPRIPAQDPYHVDVAPNWRLTLFGFGNKIINRSAVLNVAFQAQRQARAHISDTPLPHRVTYLDWHSSDVHLGCSLGPDQIWNHVFLIGHVIESFVRDWDTVSFFFDITAGPGGPFIGTGFLML